MGAPAGRASPGEVRRPGRWLVAALLALAAAAAGVYLLIRSANDVPDFPALAASPGEDLHGTVAYLDWSYGPCLHVVAAAGAPSKKLGCLGEDAVTAELLWLPDGRLQVTNGDAWQRIYDVRTGDVEEVPASSIDGAATWEPDAVNDDGDTVTATSEGGSVRVVVTPSGGSPSTVMDEEGGSTYSINTSPTWSPDGTFVLLTDAAARLLLITPEDATTWILAEELGNSWAITAEDLLTTNS